ncbi:hypothetical protein, partial [Streptococcus varani]
LAKNLASKTSHTQKPHSDFFILIVFKTEITVWFYLKLLFAQPPSLRFYRTDCTSPQKATASIVSDIDFH